jgi:hypothetical protein
LGRETVENWLTDVLFSLRQFLLQEDSMLRRILAVTFGIAVVLFAEAFFALANAGCDDALMTERIEDRLLGSIRGGNPGNQSLSAGQVCERNWTQDEDPQIVTSWNCTNNSGVICVVCNGSKQLPSGLFDNGSSNIQKGNTTKDCDFKHETGTCKNVGGTWTCDLPIADGTNCKTNAATPDFPFQYDVWNTQAN